MGKIMGNFNKEISYPSNFWVITFLEKAETSQIF